MTFKLHEEVQDSWQGMLDLQTMKTYENEQIKTNHRGRKHIVKVAY